MEPARLKVVVVGDPDTVTVFGLAGYMGVEVGSGEEMFSTLSRLVEREDIGLIITTHDLVEEVEERYYDLKARLLRPLLLEIPSARNPSRRGVDYLALFKRMMGVG